jgi:rhamnose utilization protein RhaD (predicted bifunctional aldolase and dehydrogenase)
MNSNQISIATDIRSYCSKIGEDPLLVQGAGGNASWKDGNTLWVKASGKWLSRAKNEEIFIPIDLDHLRYEISNENFFITPIKKERSEFKPSIETMLHALMPHKIVVHLHPVEILAHLVRKNPLNSLKGLIRDSINWDFVDYFQPGPELAKAIFLKLVSNPNPDVVFLKNHGIIIGGEDISGIQEILQNLILTLGNNVLNPIDESHHKKSGSDHHVEGFTLSNDKRLNLLATDSRLSKRLKNDWILYPDHAVFLGENPVIIDEKGNFNVPKASRQRPPFIFALNHGVLESNSLSKAQKSQLLCYYNVLIRQSTTEQLAPLEENQVKALLNWDAEKYRQMLSTMK